MQVEDDKLTLYDMGRNGAWIFDVLNVNVYTVDIIGRYTKSACQTNILW